MKALVFLEHHDARLSRDSCAALGAVAGVADEICGVVIGSGMAELAVPPTATTIFVADDERLAAPLPQPRVELIARLVREERFDLVVLSQSVLSSDIAAGLAIRLRAGIVWGLVGLELRSGELVGTKTGPGDVVVEAGWTSELRIAVLQAGAFAPVETEGETPTIRTIEVELDPASLLVELVEASPVADGGPALEEAEVIVGAGRGVGGPDGVALVEELAAALGGAVAASGAVVGAGWCPPSSLVGQTGRRVAPKLYVAAGVSGAMQHRVGMQRSGTIVAINLDPNAPIFDLADLAVVGDLHSILPRLIELVREQRDR